MIRTIFAIALGATLALVPINPIESIFSLELSIPTAEAADCASKKGATRTACEEIRYQSYRNTSGTPITSHSNHCDTVLRRDGEPITVRVFARGEKASSPKAVPLPRLTWAGKNSAGTRFKPHGLKDSSGRIVHEMEMCADSSVWRKSLAAAGVTREMIRKGQVIVAICGWDFSHHLPAKRVLQAMDGTGSGGVYSVLSKKDTRRMERELTRLGY